MLFCRTINRLLGNDSTFIVGGNVRSSSAVTLSALTLSASSVAENSAQDTVVGSVQGKTTGSTLSLIGTAGGRFALDGSNRIVTGATALDYEAGTSHDITIRETLAGATNSPRDTVRTITVTDVDEVAPVLSAPSGAGTGGTTANIGVTSDEANGTLYWSILPAASAAPNAAAFLGGTTGGVTTGSTASPNAGSNGFSPSGLASETSYKAHFFQQDAAGNNSNVVSSSSFTTTDITAPTLSSPVDSASGSTGATLAVTTTEGNGTLYFYLSTSATPPSAADLKAGTGAVASGSQAVSATGVQNINGITGLTASTTYYAHFLHRDAATNESAIVSGDGFTTSAGGADPYSPLIARPTPTGTTYNVSTSDSAAAIKAIYDAASPGDKLAFAAGTYDADAIFTQGFNRPGVIVGPQVIGANDADPFGDGSGEHWARCTRNVIFEFSSIGADGSTLTPNVISAADVTVHDILWKLASGTWPADGSSWATTLGAYWYERAAFLVPYSGAHRYKVLFCEFSTGYGAGQAAFDPSLSNSYYDYTAAPATPSINRLINGPVCVDGRYYKGDSCTIYGNYFHDLTGGFHNIMPGSGTLWIQHNWGERFYHDWSNLLGQSTHTTIPSSFIIEQNIGVDPFSNSADTSNPHQDFDQIQFQHNTGGSTVRVKGIRSNRNAVFSHETTRGTGIQINFHPLVSGASESVCKVVARGSKYRENFAVMSGSSHGLDTGVCEHLYVRGNVIAHLPGLDTSPSLARITWKNGSAYVVAVAQKTYKGGNIFEGPTVGSIQTYKEDDFELGWVTGRSIPDANIWTGDLTTYPTSLADAFTKLKTKGIYSAAGCSAANIREHILAPLDWTGEQPFVGFGAASNVTPSTLITAPAAWVHGGDTGDTHTFTPGAGLEARTLLASDGTTEVQTWTTSPITGVQTDNHVVQIRGNSAAADNAVQYSYDIDGLALTWDVISTYTPYTTAAFNATGAVAQPSNAGAGSNSKYLTYALEMAVPADVTIAKDIYTVVSGTGTMKIQILSDESLRMYVYNSAGTQILQINTAQKFSIGGASRRVLVSVDTTQATNTDGVKVFFDGVEDTGATLSGWSVNADIGHSRSVRRKLGGAIGFTFGMLWVSNTWVNISDPVERAKFNASNIGSDGSGVTGAQPPIFMWGDVTKLNSGSANYGSVSFAKLADTIS